MKKETPAIKSLTPSRVRGVGISKTKILDLGKAGKYAKPNIAETMDAWKSGGKVSPI